MLCITPQYDNFMYVSTRGTSVVDHFITVHDCVNNVTECRVDLCSDIIKDLGIESMIPDTCKVPDHSLLTIQIKTSPYSLQSCMLGAKNYVAHTSVPKYKVSPHASNNGLEKSP